ncbi:nuclear pore complex protein Nup160-like [Antedon mediterranea]|uniref:nuclear pore complex protein Nup160-like n=1 Tax=Antedon mediterranea TaxID=105859 RepID=UPI003AF77514
MAATEREEGMMSCLSELLLFNSDAFEWKDLTINIGDGQSALQDVQVPDGASGFTYRHSDHVDSATRNRFIYWRSSKDTLELIEDSLDGNLCGNAVRIHMQGSVILPTVTVHETHANVIILVTTVNSVLRLVFPHPSRMQRVDQYASDCTISSIFADISIASIQDPANLYTLDQTGSHHHEIHTSSSCLTNEGEALFAMTTRKGSIILVKLTAIGLGGIVSQRELSQPLGMSRLLSGLVPSVFRGGQDSTDAALSVCMHSLGQDTFIISVCKDHFLRIWSCKNQECIVSSSLLDFIPDKSDIHDAVATGHIIKKAYGSDNKHLILGVYLDFPDRCQFMLVQFLQQNGKYQLKKLASLYSPKDTLVDFCLSEQHVWTVWTSGAETIAKYTDLKGGWKTVSLSVNPTPEVLFPPFLESREVYLQEIFDSGRFCLQSIARALNICQRSIDGHITETNLNPNVLRKDVIAAIENEIKHRFGGGEMDQNEYCEIQQQTWSNFYTCCHQYHEVANKPVGIFVDINTQMPVLIKKNVVSVLRPCDILEEVYLNPEQCSMVKLEEFTQMQDEHTLSQDLITISKILKLIQQRISCQDIASFEHNLFHQEQADILVEQIADSILVGISEQQGISQSEITNEISQAILNFVDPIKAILLILNMLDLTDENLENSMMDENGLDATDQMLCGNLFKSDTALYLQAATLGRIAENRLHFCRDLLILQCMIQRLGMQAGISLDTLEKLQRECVPRTSMLVHSYFAVWSFSRAKATQVHSNTVESNQRQMAALEISTTQHTAGQRVLSRCQTILELFLSGVGGQQIRTKLVQTGCLSPAKCTFWTSVFPLAVNSLLRLVWPNSPNFLLAEYLVAQCQFHQLQEYLRLLSPWCKWNVSSRKFIQGQCYLNSAEPYKALDCFQQAAHRIADENFMLHKLLMTEQMDGQHLDTLYYLKVIRLFEQFCYPDLVIMLANIALSVGEEDDTNIPILWCKVFKHHLELGNNEQAYAAMTANTDPERRNDCLRQFVVVLCETGQIKQLCKFPYIDLHDEVVNIIESRARSVDLKTHNYYDFLYAFHTFRGNYRKAGRTMYEYGMRLGQEVIGEKALQQQAKCYLAAMNSLRLVDTDYAWIVKPVCIEPNRQDMIGASPKRNSDGEDKITQGKRQVEVIELDQIEKEYLLVTARLQYIKHSTDPASATGPTLSAHETVSLLVSVGLFDVAVTVCQTFKLSLQSILEGLTLRCVRLSLSGDVEPYSWEWLSANEVTHLQTTKDQSPADLAWRMLRSYLEKFDQVGDHRHYRWVVHKLLSLGYHIPNWLFNSYKSLDTAEFLHLLISFDKLLAACLLVIEYIDAVLGKGPEFFKLGEAMNASSGSICLPYLAIDHLCKALHEVQSDPELVEAYHMLVDKLDHYQEKARRISEDRIAIATQMQIGGLPYRGGATPMYS